MKGQSLLFTQLAQWKGLLNMKYEESGESERAGEKRGNGANERGVVGYQRKGVKG